MKINKTKLQKALELVKPGLANKELIEQTRSFAFISHRIVTYNDEISISHPVEGIDFEGAIQANELYQLLSKIKKDEIELTLEGNELRLSAGRSKAGIILQSEIKLPLKEIGSIQKWKALPDKFIEAIKFTVMAASSDASRPVLTCLHINKQGFVEASDNIRIAQYKLDKPMPVNTFLIPATIAIELSKLPITKIAEGDSWVHFKTNEDTIVSCRIFEDKFPDTSPLLKVEGEEIAFPKTILDILDRAMVFSKREHTLDEIVKISLSGKKIRIHSESEVGWFEEVDRLGERIEGELIFSIVPSLFKNILTRTKVGALTDRMIKFAEDNWIYITSLIE